MKIMYLYCNDGQIVTGGQKYEDNLYRLMRDTPGLDVDRVWLHNITQGWKKYLAMFGNLSQASRLTGYDLVIFNSAQAVFFLPLIKQLRAKGVRTAVVHHHFLFHQVNGWRRKLYKFFETSFLREASEIIVPSPYIDDLTRKMYPGHSVRYWQIPFERPASAPAASPIPGNLLYIGTIEQRKGLIHLVNAMSLLKKNNVDCRLTVVGKSVDPSYRQMIDSAVTSAGLDVTFTGFVSDDELQRIISEADIFTFPSRLEGYGMVICESMTHGLPVICFDNSAMPYTVKDDVNGLLVADGDEKAMAEAIQRVVTDRPLRQRLSQGALDTVDTFMTPARFEQTVRHDTLSMGRAQD